MNKKTQKDKFNLLCPKQPIEKETTVHF